MVSHQGATMSHTATVSHTAASHSCPSTVWACPLAVQSLCAPSVALQASQTHSQLASPLSQRVPANVHLTANVSALGFTVSECLHPPVAPGARKHLLFGSCSSKWQEREGDDGNEGDNRIKGR